MSEIIVRFLEPEAVVLGLKATTAREVIDNLGGKLMQAGYVRDSFVEAALTRESSLPTGLPLAGEINAAIPHTDVEHVVKSGLALATLASPVVFKNMINPEEDVPVSLVFVMALDQPKAQVEMLQEIAGLLQNDALVSLLMQAKTYEEVKQALLG
ncbi:MAG: PTS sugar transporter subunit IIA [Chloroflexi bacterium]|nr:PTS sugar transporter subunit IIA [Chloroflexota bacterium]